MDANMSLKVLVPEKFEDATTVTRGSQEPVSFTWL